VVASSLKSKEHVKVKCVACGQPFEVVPIRGFLTVGLHTTKDDRVCQHAGERHVPSATVATEIVTVEP
jgi:hypothetical protein